MSYVQGSRGLLGKRDLLFAESGGENKNTDICCTERNVDGDSGTQREERQASEQGSVH